MSLRRQISWAAATRDMRADRAAIPAGFLAARAHVTTMARVRRLVLATRTGGFDRSAIMSLAAAAAKAQQIRTGEPWSACISIALKAAWLAAKVARINGAH